MRAGLFFLTFCACATPRMQQIRATGAVALQCPADSLWLVEDGNGWSAAGCEKIASGIDPMMSTGVVPATCEGIAGFEYRMCMLVARQRAVAAGSDQGNVSSQSMENADGDACRLRYKERTDTCLKAPPPRAQQPATQAPAAEPPATAPTP